LLAVAVAAFVVGFGSSDALANAYGVAVVGTMIVTTVLGSFVAMKQWGWPPWTVVALFGILLAMDCTFMAGNLTKIDHGGWIPLTLGAVLFGVFSVWRSGRTHLRAALARMAIPRTALPKLLKDVYRVPGTGVFLASDADIVPSALIRNLEHNHVAHERILILNIEITRTPRQDPSDRVHIQELMPNVYAITAIFGFMETPVVGEALPYARLARVRGRLLVLRRPACRACAAAPRAAGHRTAAVRAHAAPQHSGRGVLPHARARPRYSDHRR
jgi:KUP system potassium uptake protein